MTHLDRKELAKIVRLKQTDSVWLCSARPSGVKIGEADEGAIQPYVILVLDATDQMARTMDLSIEGMPDVERVAVVLAQAMYAPMHDAPPEFSAIQDDLKPMRPQRILIDDVALVASLKPVFAEADVEVNYHPELTPIDQYMQMFQQMAQPKDSRVPLLEIPGVQAPLLAELFAASAKFWDEDVWEDLSNAEIIRVRYLLEPGQGQSAAQSKEYFVSVMGNGGEEFGLAIFETIEDVNALFNIEEDNPAAGMMTMRSLSFSFSPKDALLKADVAAFKKHKWAKPSREEYLSPMRYSMEAGLTSPTADEIAMAAAVFRVLPQFAYEEMKADGASDLASATKTYALPSAHGGASVELSYPVAGLELPQEDVADFLDLENNPGLLDKLMNLFGGAPEDEQPRSPPANKDTWKKRK